MVDKELLAILVEMFPDQLPVDRDISEREVSYLQGQQSVIKKLQQIYEEENGWTTLTINS